MSKHFRCQICNKTIYNAYKTVISTSDSGAIIYSRVCKKCAQDDQKIMDLMQRNDERLKLMDQLKHISN